MAAADNAREALCTLQGCAGTPKPPRMVRQPQHPSAHAIPWQCDRRSRPDTTWPPSQSGGNPRWRAHPR
eukprot:4882642-Alexandrium_andersonii.AAC.1